MADGYIQSNSIDVFPLSKPRTNKKNNRLLGEKNIVDIINQITDKTSFVISKGIYNAAKFEFNIHGYYFKISTNLTSLPAFSGATDGTNIYGVIYLTKNVDFPEIAGQDSSGVYAGLRLTTDDPSAISGEVFDVYYLKLLTKSGSNWIIPPESNGRFSDTALGITIIDGGLV